MVILFFFFLVTYKRNQLTVPLIETRIVPIREPKRRPADMVKGIAGIASI